jgi:hypothetical protein
MKKKNLIIEILAIHVVISEFFQAFGNQVKFSVFAGSTIAP